MSDIDVIPAPKSGGKLYGIGDVHGALTEFKAWLAGLKPGDVGISLGDLVDRGENSPGVILALVEHNKKNENSPVYAIRGNHEAMSLKALQELEKNFNLIEHDLDAPQILAENNNDIALHVLNGGEWLVNLFVNEIDRQLIKFDEATQKIVYDENSQIAIIKQFLEEMPHQILVDDINPVLFVHADAPLNDQDTYLYINRQIPLTDNQNNYGYWAREDRGSDNRPSDTIMQDVGRSPYSMLMATGHNVVGKATDHMLDVSKNKINIDVEAYENHALLSVNFTDGKVAWVHQPEIVVADIKQDMGDNEFGQIDWWEAGKFYLQEATLLQKHLAAQKELTPFLREANKCDNLDQLEKCIARYESKTLPDDALYMLLFNRNTLNEQFIINAMKDGDLPFLIEKGLSPNYTFKNGEGLFFAAIKSKNFEAAHVLLENNANPYLLNGPPDRLSPLAAAIETKDEPLIKAVIQMQLMNAISRKDEEAMIKAIKQGADVFFIPNDEYMNPFELANEYKMLYKLIRASVIQPSELPAGVSADNTANRGWTTAHAMAIFREDKLPEVKESLDAKARIPAEILLFLFEKRGIMNAKTEHNLQAFVEKNPIDNGNIEMTARDILRIRGLEPEMKLQADVTKKVQTTRRDFGLFRSPDKTVGAAIIDTHRKNNKPG